MRLAITGGTGYVGRFVTEEALAAGDTVTVLTRSAPQPGDFAAEVDHVPYDLLSGVPELAGVDALVHAAFSHLPGRYRGGEGDDPEGFLRANLDGTRRLFDAAREAGVARILFLSSRAVYGAWPPGTRLSEEMEPRPDTLYGKVKRDAEIHLAGLNDADCATASLRVTGVYGAAGPGQDHKWQQLFADFAAGRPIDPRVATEVHGRDVAAALRCLLSAPPGALSGQVFNVSDLLLDRRDLLAMVAESAGIVGALPNRADPAKVNVMDTTRMRRLGWAPGGMPRLRESLHALAVGENSRG